MRSSDAGLRWLSIGLITMSAFLVTSTASAQFPPGDVLLAVWRPIDPLNPNGPIECFLYDFQPNGSLVTHVPVERLFTDLQSNGVGLYGTSDFVFRIAGDGVLTWLPSPSLLLNLLVLNGRGEILSAPASAPSLLGHFDAGGAFTGTLALPGAPVALDLAADQCTLFYVSGGQIQRFDVCKQQALSPFPKNYAGTPRTLRLLGNGSVLVSTTDRGVSLLDPAGSLVRTYGGTPSGLLALAADGTSFWVVLNTGVIQRFDTVSGATLGQIQLPAGFFHSALAVVGEPRAAVAPAAIPIAGPVALFFLALVVVLVAIARIA